MSPFNDLQQALDRWFYAWRQQQRKYELGQDTHDEWKAYVNTLSMGEILEELSLHWPND